MDNGGYFWELIEQNTGLKLRDHIKQAINNLGLNTLEAYQNLNASHIEKIKNTIVAQKKPFGIESQRKLFQIKNKIRTHRKQWNELLRAKLKNQTGNEDNVAYYLEEDDDEEADDVDEDEMKDDDIPSNQIFDLTTFDCSRDKSIDPEFYEKMSDPEFREKIIEKLHNNLKQYIYKYTDNDKIEKPTLELKNGKLQGKSKCPECGGVFVVQSEIKRLNVKWIPSNMRKHYNRHFNQLKDGESLRPEILKLLKNKIKKSPTKVQKSKPILKTPTKRVVKLIVPKMEMKIEKVESEVPEDLANHYDDLEIDQNIEVLDEEHSNTVEEQIFATFQQQQEDQEEDQEQYGQEMEEDDDEEEDVERYYENEEQLENPEEEEFLEVANYEKKFKISHSQQNSDPSSVEVVFNTNRSCIKIEDDDPDWLYCKTICAMMKTIPLKEKNQLKIDILTMTSQRQQEALNSENN